MNGAAGWLYLILMTGEVAQLNFTPTTCHILAEHYADGGYFRVWDAETRREKWLHVDKAVCIETVDVASNLKPAGEINQR